MAPPKEDKIDAVPGMLLDVKMGQLDQFNPTAELQPGMVEGKAFAKKDTEASKLLSQFVNDVNFGLDSYTKDARTYGQDYLNTDQLAAAQLKSVTSDISA